MGIRSSATFSIGSVDLSDDALQHAHAACAAAVCPDDPGGIVPAVPGPADGRADGAATARRGAGRVELGDADLSGAAAGRLCLCALAGANRAATAGGHPS